MGMNVITPTVGSPVMYFSDVDMDGDLDPTFMMVGEILLHGYLKLAPMPSPTAVMPPGFKNPVPHSPIPAEGHWCPLMEIVD